MKGLMVTLLMFLTTGTVVGQQGSSSTNSVVPAIAGAQNDLLKPLEIGVSADAIRAIRSGKVLVSKMEAVDPVSGKKLSPDVISGVALYQEGKTLNSLPKQTVRGQDNGDGVLRFSLTDANLRALENNQLKMDFGLAQRGKFQEIEVSYSTPNQSTTPSATRNTQATQQPFRPSENNAFTAPAARAPATRTPVTRAPVTRTPTPDNTAAGRQLAFGRRNTATNNSVQTPIIPLPAPAEPGDTNFMGPSLPAAGNWRPPNQTTQNNPDLIPNRQTDFVSTQNTSGWNLPASNDRGFNSNSRQTVQQDDRQNAIDEMKAKWEAERLQREYQEHMRQETAERLRREEEERELAQWNWEQEQIRNNRSQTTLSPMLNGPNEIQSRLSPEQELAYNRAIWELERKEDLLKSQAETLERKSNLIDLAQTQINSTMRQQSWNNQLPQSWNNQLPQGWNNQLPQAWNNPTQTAQSWNNQSLPGWNALQQVWNNPLANPTLRTNMPQDANPDWERSNGIIQGSHHYPEGPVVARTRAPISPNDFAHNNVDYPDNGYRSNEDNRDIAPRFASNSRGIDKYTAKIAGPNSPNSLNSSNGANNINGPNTTFNKTRGPISNAETNGNRQDRVSGFVLFLLLCSLGLNFYLAFISRGFYVRYHELADELRETFSTTH